ncbi:MULTISPECIES: tRNA (adenosine(37)-N6)-threonylcarbamoyltransferase complex ATPase subunit type 1 TsaE [Brevibacillus]|jgi:tRNA threonylcarbamoyladenosine biosynthesis protein TsaE|uniref:tRNA (adenosine(37)-N6)-threonylcarbamoyltransferase complex ATPase subunit type 1 TsaE n=1 Tax=Brevibacillus TaxID=55080 RepID=UPI0009E023A9|nr:tRNA (adenosine(37)-N6)-threonylcarbamoyltransferase complex ATPase subunit type 1 TsaE [Brevibacillus borstelensis]MCC0566833.1 tRNA (adenosine(37)-N6)-threonylcarbamoyltransferase complex ATPase subunit type 1 TsaE [Brevibacillus borstelensis]MCM3472805.1 tRNA (adenosine(37)-N6)-threonylcarbamoyltransferase complex ATPase subunit type 1 TsaE [Brevibacillus borstelensis]MCM3561334.1 tRNA (adenosine(37)-N6)-threonylcarbamoyltransferase complex ATPase subunit type 1 TsaE [Brevibacillus borstel
MKYEWNASGVEETLRFAEKLGVRLLPGDFLALEGDLGAGKTTFTQGLARGLEVKGTVNSPTFTIIKEYEGRLPLYHMDVYRVGEDVDSLGLDDYFFGEGVTVVEWASLIEDVLPPERLTVILRSEGDDARRIQLIPRGDRYVKLCEEIDW